MFKGLLNHSWRPSATARQGPRGANLCHPCSKPPPSPLAIRHTPPVPPLPPSQGHKLSHQRAKKGMPCGEKTGKRGQGPGEPVPGLESPPLQPVSFSSQVRNTDVLKMEITPFSSFLSFLPCLKHVEAFLGRGSNPPHSSDNARS